MTDKSKPLTLSSTPLLAVVLPAKRESAICIWDQPTRVEGEQKRKEGRKKQPHLPGFSFPPLPCAKEWDISYCRWLAQRQHKMAVQRGEQEVVRYSCFALKKISKPLPSGNVFLSPYGFLSLLFSLRMGHLLCGSKVAPPGTCTRKEYAGLAAHPQEGRIVHCKEP